jgi:hypothetical protein
MKPKLYVGNFDLAALGVAPSAHQLSAGFLTPSIDSRKSNSQEPSGPYPGICTRSASELLDFGFENTEILQERED